MSFLKGNTSPIIGSNILGLKNSGKSEKDAVGIALSTAKGHPGKNLGAHLHPKGGLKPKPKLNPMVTPPQEPDEDDAPPSF